MPLYPPASSGGGGTVPTGTGFTHITTGAQDAASKLVDPTADLATGTGAITIAAGGTNQNINLTPIGTGTVNLPSGGYLTFANTPYALYGTAGLTALNSPNTYGIIQLSILNAVKANLNYTGVFTFGASYTTLGNTWASFPKTPAQIVANQNNYNPGLNSFYQRWSTDAARNITGMVFADASVGGQSHTIVNVGSFDIVLVNESTLSTAGNRFHNSTAADITLATDQAAELFYDTTTARWRVFKRN